MKKKLLFIASLILAMGLSACGNAKNTANNDSNNEQSKTSTIKSIDDLQGKNIGVQLSTTGHLFAEEKYKDDKDTEVKSFSKGAEAVASLKQGLVDCVIIDEQTANVFINQNPDLQILEEPFETEEYAICTAKENTELLDKINQALTELKEDGTFQKIVDNYIGDNKGQSSYSPSSENTGSAGTLIAATNAHFPPYEFYENDKVVGIDAELAQAIADKLDMTLQIDDMEFDTIIASVQSGKASIGIAGMSITEERKENVSFTNPYVNTKQVIIIKK